MSREFSRMIQAAVDTSYAMSLVQGQIWVEPDGQIHEITGEGKTHGDWALEHLGNAAPSSDMDDEAFDEYKFTAVEELLGQGWMRMGTFMRGGDPQTYVQTAGPLSKGMLIVAQRWLHQHPDWLGTTISVDGGVRYKTVATSDFMAMNNPTELARMAAKKVAHIYDGCCPICGAAGCGGKCAPPMPGHRRASMVLAELGTSKQEIMAIRPILRSWVAGGWDDRDRLLRLMSKHMPILTKFRPNKPMRLWRNERQQALTKGGNEIDGLNNHGWEDQYQFPTAWSVTRHHAETYAAGPGRRLVTAVVPVEDMVVSIPMVDYAARQLGLKPIDKYAQDEVVVKANPSILEKIRPRVPSADEAQIRRDYELELLNENLPAHAKMQAEGKKVIPESELRQRIKYMAKEKDIHDIRDWMVKKQKVARYHVDASKTLYHGTSRERAEKIMREGLEPQVGNLTEEAYGEDAESVDHELEPLTFAADKGGIGRGVFSAMLHAIEADGHDTTDRELAIRNWGAIVVIKEGEDVFEHKSDDEKNQWGQYEDHPMQVESGDYYSREGIEPSYAITGPALVKLLKRKGVTLAPANKIPKERLDRLVGWVHRMHPNEPIEAVVEKVHHLPWNEFLQSERYYQKALAKTASWTAPSFEQMKWTGATPKLYAAAKARLEGLQFPLTLYRAVKLTDEKALWTAQAGIYWTDQLDRAQFYTPAGKKAPGAKYVLRAEVGPHVIDWDATFNANCEPQGRTGTWEQEIKLHASAPVVINGILGPGETEFSLRNIRVTAKSQPAADKETEEIRERAKTPEAQKPHDFEAAEWTCPNGHPRCRICGDEEPVSGRCNGASKTAAGSACVRAWITPEAQVKEFPAGWGHSGFAKKELGDEKLFDHQAVEMLRDKGWSRMGTWDDLLYIDGPLMTPAQFNAIQGYVQTNPSWQCTRVDIYARGKGENVGLKEFLAANKMHDLLRRTAAAKPDLHTALRKVYKDDRFHEILSHVPPAGVGAFDGGCLICAEALIMAAGHGELVAIAGDDAQAQHYGAKIDGGYYDFDGVMMSANGWLKRFIRVEHLEQTHDVSTWKVVPADQATQGIVPRDEAKSKQIAALITEALATRKTAISAPRQFFVALGRATPDKFQGIKAGTLPGVQGVSIDLEGLKEFTEKSDIVLAMPGPGFLQANPNARPVDYGSDALLKNNMQDYVRVRQTGSQAQAVVAVFYSEFQRLAEEAENSIGALDFTWARFTAQVYKWLGKRFVKGGYTGGITPLPEVHDEPGLVAAVQVIFDKLDTLISNSESWYDPYGYLWEDLQAEWSSEAAVHNSLHGSISFTKEREWVITDKVLHIPAGTEVRLDIGKANKYPKDLAEVEAWPLGAEALDLARACPQFEVVATVFFTHPAFSFSDAVTHGGTMGMTPPGKTALLFQPRRIWKSTGLLVTVDVAKIEAAYRQDGNFYVGPNGSGAAIGNRYNNFKQWLQDNPETPIDPPIMGLSPSKGIVFGDGRHRWAVLRDQGEQHIAVMIPPEEFKVFQQLYGAEKVEGPMAKTAGAVPVLRVDNPGGDWLESKRQQSHESGKNQWGNPKNWGPVTASFKGNVLMPVSLIQHIPGMRGEQSNVRPDTISWMTENMGQSGRLPQMDGNDYAPFIMVDTDGNPWVSEGNHRIMTAVRLGWRYLPVEIRYFSGGEQVHTGSMAPQKVIQRHQEAERLGFNMENYSLKDPLDVKNPKQAAAAMSPEFKAWFGKSKAVNPDGTPMKFFHGTSKDKDFGAFKDNRRGIFFTPDPKGASEYATSNDSMGAKYNPDTRRYEDVNTAPRVIPVYLRMENPYVMEGEVMEAYVHATNYAKFQRDLADRAKMKGFDGIIYPDGSWVVFEPTQIKSAIGNSGTYNPKDKKLTAKLFQHKIAMDLPEIHWVMPTDAQLLNELRSEYHIEQLFTRAMWPKDADYQQAILDLKAVAKPEILDPKALAGLHNRWADYDALKKTVTGFGGPKDPDSMLAAIKAGQPLPMPMVVRHPDGGLEILGGNTRSGIALLAGQPIHALVMDETAAMHRLADRTYTKLRAEFEAKNPQLFEALRAYYLGDGPQPAVTSDDDFVAFRLGMGLTQVAGFLGIDTSDKERRLRPALEAAAGVSPKTSKLFQKQADAPPVTELQKSPAQRIDDTAKAHPLQAPQRLEPTKTPEFQAWFKGSKVVNRDGSPKVVYHGSTHAFDKFDLSSGNNENFYGKGFYFTDSKVDVNNNYGTDQGKDLLSRVEQRAEYLMDNTFTEEEDGGVQGLGRQEALALARKEIAGQSMGTVYLTYLRILKPVIVQPKGGTRFEGGDWDPKDEDNWVESKQHTKLYEATLRAADELGVRGDQIWQDATGNLEIFEGYTAYQFEQGIREGDECMDAPGGPGPLIARIWQLMGFDGIIMDAEAQFGKGMDMSPGTQHYIVWNPRQVKSALGNSGKFNPRSPSMVAKLFQKTEVPA